MLATLINPNELEALAGGTAFRRGEEYFSVGAVGRLRVQENKVSAKMEGTETYQVELRDEEGELAADCTCPRAGDGYFCKHCVAVGLAWLDEHGSASSPADGAGRKPARAKRRDPWKDIRQYLETQPAESLSELLQPDSAAMLVGLAEHAIEKIESVMEQVDDSNGEIGGIVCRLGELHLKACTLAKPDPAALAERLFRFETTLPFGLCSFDAATYRAPLGKKGLQRYRELAEAEWQKIKPRADDKGYDAHRSPRTPPRA